MFTMYRILKKSIELAIKEFAGMFLACTVVLWDVGRFINLTELSRGPLPHFSIDYTIIHQLTALG